LIEQEEFNKSNALFKIQEIEIKDGEKLIGVKSCQSENAVH